MLLAALRFVQGFAVGGEWGGAVLMAGEFGDAARRGSWAGWPQVGVPAGNLLAAGVLAVMAAAQSEADFLAWGWRVAFLLSGLLVAIGWWVRSTLSESPQFEAAQFEAEAARAAKAVEPAPAIQALKHRPGGIAVGAGLKFGENISYYVVTTFSIAYLAETVHAKRQVGLNAVLIGSAVEMVTMPLFSALATGSAGDRSTPSARWRWRSGRSCSSACCTAARAAARSSRDGGGAGAARGDVRPAGRVHLRALPHPLSLFRRLDRLPGDLDLRRLAGAGDRRGAAASAPTSTTPIAVYVAARLRGQRHRGADRARDPRPQLRRDRRPKGIRGRLSHPGL